MCYIYNLEEVSFKNFDVKGDGFYKRIIISEAKLIGKKFDNVIAEFVRLEHNNDRANGIKKLDHYYNQKNWGCLWTN